MMPDSMLAIISRLDQQITHACNGSSQIAEVKVTDLKALIEEYQQNLIYHARQEGVADAYLAMIGKLLDRME